MKTTNILAALFAASALISCSKETVSPVSGSFLNVSVEDNGFISEGTKAAVDNRNTVFTEGDKIGVFGVKDGKIISTVSNLCLTAVSDNGSLTWTADNGKKLENDPGIKYFAYYPYEFGHEDEVSPEASDADGFFADVAKNWLILNDQSSTGSFTSSDLMFAEGTISDGILMFTMDHAMALISIDLPKKRYVFTNTPSIPDYVLPMDNLTFIGFEPLPDDNVTFLFITNPYQEAQTFSGSYDYEGKTREWSFTTAGEAGKITTYRIDKSLDFPEISHYLQPGDFFLSDGTLLSKDAPAQTVQEADVVGIVFQTDPDRIGQGEKEALGGNAHGLVLATKAIGGEVGYYEWYYTADQQFQRDEKEIGMKDISDGDPYKTYDNVDNDLEGYTNNRLIREKRSGDFLAGYYPVFKAAAEFANETGGDYSSTTGWYLPSSGQWFDILRNLAGTVLLADESKGFIAHQTGDMSWTDRGLTATSLNRNMANVAADHKTEFKTGGSYNYFWTSSSANFQGAMYIGLSDDIQGMSWTSIMCLWDYKKSLLCARAILAF